MARRQAGPRAVVVGQIDRLVVFRSHPLAARFCLRESMRCFFRFASALLLGPLVAAARPALDARPTHTPPTIDGIIRPGEWDGAAHSNAFRQAMPVENADPSEHTEFWVTYDADNLYIAVRAHDREAATIPAIALRRDQDDGSDDLIRIAIDPFHRANDGYFFALTSAGGKHDGLIQNKGEPRFEWDAIWHGKVSIDAHGWSAEFAIPAKTISFNPANPTWGFNIGRAIRRRNEAVRWSGYSRLKNSISLPDMGEIRGISNLHQGHGVDFKPYASLTARSHPRPGEKNTEFKPGFDLIWHVTPSLAATFTVNTDFADAEVDERQVNLGRFPLFFPEKRAFFLQDAPLFTFAGLSQNPLPFFSRRIGLAADGSKVDILGGIKLTGRAGPLSLGLLDVQLDEHAGVDSKNLFVGRASLNVLEESTVGLIATHGDPRGNGDNNLVGADFNYVNNRFLGNKVLIARASAQFTDSDYAGGRGDVRSFRLSLPNEPLEVHWIYHRISDRYDPALGFVRRTGIQSLLYMHHWHWNFSPASPLRKAIFQVDGDFTFDLHGRRLDRAAWLSAELHGQRRDRAYVWVEFGAERLLDPFAIRPGIVVPAGDYRWTAFAGELETSPSRPLRARAEFRFGPYLSGRRTDFAPSLIWQPSPRFELKASVAARDFDLREGHFVSRLASARATYFPTPDLQLSLLAQYDNFSEQLGTNFRVKWIVQPGNEIYFVVNQGYDTSLDRFRPTGNETSLKGAWTFRF